MTVRSFTYVALSLAMLASCAEPVPPDVAVAQPFARLPQSVGNVTFTPEGRMIFSHHPFFEPAVRVAELDEGRTGFKPFPNMSWNTPRPGTDEYLDSVLGVRGDERGVVWMLDMGQRTGVVPKLVGWNTREDRLERIYRIPAPASLDVSQHNDFVVDHANGAFYIADEAIGRGGDGSRGALVVVDMRTGAARRLLEGHESTRPADVPIMVGGRELRVGGEGGSKRLLVGADGIAADKNFEWLYFGPLNGEWLYRVRTADLRDAALSPERLVARVERYASKTNNGGISVDERGNIYSTEVETGSVGVIEADTRRYRRFAAHPEMHWPDGVSCSPDGWMYVPASQIGRAAPFNGGQALNRPPYLIFRFRPLAACRPGH